MINFCLKVKILNDMEDIWVIVLPCKCSTHANTIKDDDTSLKEGDYDILQVFSLFFASYHSTCDSKI